MRIDALHIEGLRHAPDWVRNELEGAVPLPAAPAGVAVADGIGLFAAALDPRRTQAILARMGLVGAEPELMLDEQGLAEQVVGLDPAEVEALLDPEGGRKAVVQTTLALDPPLFGKLREESMRDPRMLAALGADPTLTVRVGWLFTSDHSAASVGVLEVRVADTTFPTGRNERPRWMDGLLRSVGERIGGVGDRDGLAVLGARLLRASLAADPSIRARWTRLADALANPPFDLGRLELVGEATAPMPCFGPDLVRARQLGPRAVRALRIAEAALVAAPDVLVVEDDAISSPWAEWLAGLTEGDDATLEQVFWLTSGG